MTGASASAHHDEECLDMLQALAAERLSVMSVERVCDILEDLLRSRSKGKAPLPDLDAVRAWVNQLFPDAESVPSTQAWEPVETDEKSFAKEFAYGNIHEGRSLAVHLREAASPARHTYCRSLCFSNAQSEFGPLSDTDLDNLAEQAAKKLDAARQTLVNRNLDGRSSSSSISGIRRSLVDL